MTPGTMLSAADQRRNNKRKIDRTSQRARIALKKSLGPRHLPDVQYEVPDPRNYPVGLRSDLELAKQLQQLSSPPTTSERLKELTVSVASERLKTDLCKRLLDIFHGPISYEVDMVTTEDELTAALNSRFHLIYIPAGSNVLPLQRCSILGLIDSIPAPSGQVYLPGLAPDGAGNTTHNVDIQLLRDTFYQPLSVDPEMRYGNYLDVANWTHTEYRPHALKDVSLLHRIQQRQSTASSWARVGYSGPPTTQDQWHILTNGPGASQMHVDSAGYSTFIVGVEGRKYWHVPKGHWDVVRKEFATMGQRYTGYCKGFSVLKIGPGDCLIQAPGTPHGVFTEAGPCMIAGAFIYTAAHFARSLKCVRLYFEDRLPDNDDMKKEDYSNLTSIIQRLDSDLFTDAQREEIDVEIHQLLVAEQVIVKDDHGWTLKPASEQSRSRKASSKNPRGKESGGKRFVLSSPVNAARASFRDECHKWWQSRYQRKLEWVVA